MGGDRETRALVALREAYDQLAIATLGRTLTRRAAERGGEEWQQRARDLLELIEPRHLTHSQLRIIRRQGWSIRQALSFHTIVIERGEARRAGKLVPTWQLDDKKIGYAFADAVGIRRPKTLQAGTFGEIEPPSVPAVIKPVRSTGGRGVYVCTSPSEIMHRQRGERLDSWDDLVSHARGLMVAGHRPVRDDWIVEELVCEDIGTPGRDVKFFACYGEVLLVMEMIRHPLRVCFWNADGQAVTTGKHEDKPLDGIGVTAEHVAAIADISRQIPAPFMRIDMLRAENELVLGEFTPVPGDFHAFNPEWDRRLAEDYVRAEGRIMADLLAGKKFDAFTSITSA